jgi:ubiquinone/menaquinone biosynthesis C-methylase UbiE
MKLGEFILYNWSRLTKSPVADRKDLLGEDPGSNEYGLNYALKKQYDKCVRDGIGIHIRDKVLLEIGCGHGGISIYCAVNGARKVYGVDIDDKRLKHAEAAAESIAGSQGRSRNSIPLEFLQMNVCEINLPDNSLDYIMADNVFEHFMEPRRVLEHCYRLLRPGGMIIIRGMPSIYSMYGLHLKNGLKVPWANLFFTEKTICRVMHRLAEENPKLHDIYPGIRNRPLNVRDLRYSADLNGITYSTFKRMAQNAGFQIKMAKPLYAPKYIGKLISMIPFFANTILGDIFSHTFYADLIKPEN